MMDDHYDRKILRLHNELRKLKARKYKSTKAKKRIRRILNTIDSHKDSKEWWYSFGLGLEGKDEVEKDRYDGPTWGYSSVPARSY